MTSNVNLAISLFQAGDLNQALNELNHITNAKKAPAIAWFLTAIIQTQHQNFDSAITSFKNAIKQQPIYPDAHNNLGVVFEKKQKIEEAITQYQIAIKQRPNYASALFNLGNIYHQRQEVALAKKYYLLAIKYDKTHFKAYNNLGLLYQQENNINDAEKYFKQALKLNPSDFEVRNNLGYLYSLEDKHDIALDYYQQSIDLNPSNPEALNNAAISLQSLKRFKEAEMCFNQAIKLKKDYVAAHANLANYYKETNQTEKAKERYLKALEINPLYPPANNNYGLLLHHEGHYDLAKKYYMKAIEGNHNYQEAIYNLGTTQLASGNFIQGWSNYLSRPTARHPLAADIKTVDLNTLSNKHILLLQDQGIGDELFFLRYVKTLKSYCNKITYLSSAKISDFTKSLPELNHVITHIEEIKDYDIAFSIADIPALLAPIVKNNTLPSIMINASNKDKELLRKELSAFGPPPYIGITWRGGQQVKNFLFKSVPIESLLKAIENIKATFIILQRHPSSDELNNIHLHLPHIKMMDMSQLNEDLPRMVALLSILDDYIGVSNTNMHLNAALHKSSKVLLPHPPEWRWMLEGNISPWFPHNSIFRQQPQNRKDKSWNAAFNQLTEQLENQYGR